MSLVWSGVVSDVDIGGVVGDRHHFGRDVGRFAVTMAIAKGGPVFLPITRQYALGVALSNPENLGSLYPKLKPK